MKVWGSLIDLSLPSAPRTRQELIEKGIYVLQ